MKKKMKRPLAVLLALIMMFSTVSGTGLNLSAEELQTSEVEILTTEDSAADTEEDKSGDTKDINQEEAPEVENESEGDELTESEESEDEVEPTGDIESEAGAQPASEEAEPAAQDIGDIESEADVQPASEEAEPSGDSDSEENTQPASDEEDKSKPVTETEDDADDEESEKTETPAEITRYDYKSDEVNVLVTLTDPADLPDAAELVVEPITLQREAQKNIEEAAAEEGIFVEEIKAFDIKFMLDGEEVQPGATVKVSVSVPEFKPSEEASAVYHVDENNEVENMESEVAADGEVVFDAPHFSTYVIVDGSIINDATKKITVTLKHYTKDALVVSEDSNGVIASVTVPTDTTHQLYLDDQIEVPVGGEIYNYIKADNWKPDTVYVDYKSKDDVTYTSSTDLKEISLTEDATVWVYYTPDQSRFYGDVGFYDYTVYVEDDAKVYSINDKIDKYTGNTEKNVLIVDDAKYGNQKNSGKYGRYDKYATTKGDWNRVSTDYDGEAVFGQNINGKIQYLDENGKVLFGCYEPGLFDIEPYSVTLSNGEEVYLRKYYSDYQVGFTKVGNTYTFDQVVYPDSESSEVGYYNKGNATGWTSAGDYFYPLDNRYNDHELTYAAQEHNRFWGMRYDIDFTIGDYVGEMNFKFDTRNEYLVVLDDNILVCKSNYTYREVQESVDLWGCLFGENYNKSGLSDEEAGKEHTLTILYLDRFAHGNGVFPETKCNINFTLPNARVKEVVKVDSSDVVNPVKTTSLVLKTVDQYGESLEGATFQLKNTSTNATVTLTTTKEGVNFEALSVGEYQLMLANAPNGCEAEESSWKVTIKESTSGDLQITMIEETTGKTASPENDGSYIIGVTKIEGTKLSLCAVLEDGTKLGGAKFKLESADGKFSETKSSDYVTGEIDFSGLEADKYTLTHIKAPTGCQLIATETTEWIVTVENSDGTYSVSMNPDVEQNEDDVFVYRYEGTYVPPEGSFVYDKTAKVTSWENRTYEIDISAKAIESETIEHLDTTYGMFVFDVSSTMGNNSSEKAYSYSKGKPYSELDKDYIYKENGSYIVYLEGKWQKLTNGTWEELKEISSSNVLTRSNVKIEILKEVAINYIENLANGSKEGKLGIVTFCALTDVKTIWNLDTSIFNTDGSLNKQILTNILSIYHKSDTYPHGGLVEAYRQLVGSFEYDYKTRVFSYGEDNDSYTYAREHNIPLYVILVSDGNAWEDGKKPTEDMASYLKSKGVTVYTVATNSKDEGNYKSWLKNYVASFGCAYEVSEQDSLSEIFSQIQRTISAGTISDVTIKDYIDPRFVILDNDGNAITKEDYCNSTCSENCSEHKYKEFASVKKGKVGYDTNGQYIIWEDQTISAEEDHWCIEVKARDDYLGGNNVTTNIDGISVITTPGNKEGYTLPTPVVNVKAELKVNDNVFTIYKGETVPTTEAILNALFNESAVKSQYDATSLEDVFTLTWYTDPSCEEQYKIEPDELAEQTPEKQTKYYLKVTYNAGIPLEKSKENTTLDGKTYFVGGEENGLLDAVNANNSNLSYGIYTINVWELIKRDADNQEKLLSGAEFKLSSDDNTYTGKSNAQGSVAWIDSKDTTQYSLTLPITELDIAAGEYTLTETCAPEKYKSIETEWTAIKTAANGWDLSQNNIGHEQVTKDGITKVYIDNEKAPSAIEIKKTVTGNLGSKTKLFTFTVTLTNAKNVAIDLPTATQNDSYKVDQTEKNKATFELTDGDSITIDNLPVGAKLTILESTADLKESDGNHYTVAKVENNNEDVTQQYNENTGITVEITDSTSTVAFTNNRSATLDTGILSDTPKVQNTLLAVTFAASVIGILAYLDRKRSKYDYRR